MTAPHARTAANVIIGAAAVAAAFLVVTTPPLRLLAMRAGRLYLGGRVPAYLAGETWRAWRASRRPA